MHVVYLFSNKSETLPIEARMNITCIALSPDGYTFIAVNEGKFFISHFLMQCQLKVEKILMYLFYLIYQNYHNSVFFFSSLGFVLILINARCNGLIGRKQAL